mgnify:CR=1 FL=1
MQGEKGAKKTKAQKRSEARKRKQARKREQNMAWLNEVKDDNPNQSAHPWIHSRLRRTPEQVSSHMLPDSNTTPETSQKQCSISPPSTSGSDNTFLQQNPDSDQSRASKQISNTQPVQVYGAKNETNSQVAHIYTGNQLTVDSGAVQDRHSGRNSQLQEGSEAEKLLLEES